MVKFMRRALDWMICSKRVSALSRFCDSRQQLRGVADCTQRVADFVRNTGGQLTEGGEFGTLQFFALFGGVFQIDHGGAAGLVAQLREPRPHFGGVLVAHVETGNAWANGVQPVLQVVVEFGGELLQRFAAPVTGLTEHIPRGFVHVADRAGTFHHHNAGFELVEDRLVQL